MRKQRQADKIAIAGWGAVSPAGWDCAGLMKAALGGDDMLAVSPERTLSVPPPPDGRMPRSPRLRRASPISRFLIAAALDAMGDERVQALKSGDTRLDIIVNVLNGSTSYCARFFSEVLNDPSMASPIIFPETVFNAPASHLAAVLGSTGLNETIVGDSAQFVASLEAGIRRLTDRDCDGCLIVAAEEQHWVSSRGRKLYDRDVVTSEGSAAVYLEKSPAPEIELAAVTDPFFPGGGKGDRETAIRKARAQLGNASPEAVLIDGCHQFGPTSDGEKAAWSDWPGRRIHLKQILGDSMAASSAWSVVAGCEMLANHQAGECVISAVGGNQQVLCTRIKRGDL